MIVHKLNATGVTHFILPLVIILAIGAIGSFVAVKSQSHADNLPPTSPAGCRNIGYDSYSSHYKKCVKLRYSYTYKDRITTNDHPTKVYKFGKKFTVNISGTCSEYHSGGLVPGFYATFHSNSLNRDWWTPGYQNTTGSVKKFALVAYSDKAQTQKMFFRNSLCTYTVHVWQ